MIDVLTALLLATGCLIALSSAVGVLRLPDFFTRLHPAGKNDSLAQVLILGGLILQAGFSQVSLKLFLISLFLLVTTPSATHAIARAAYFDGRAAWTREERSEGFEALAVNEAQASEPEASEPEASEGEPC